MLSLPPTATPTAAPAPHERDLQCEEGVGEEGVGRAPHGYRLQSATRGRPDSQEPGQRYRLQSATQAKRSRDPQCLCEIDKHVANAKLKLYTDMPPRALYLQRY